MNSILSTSPLFKNYSNIEPLGIFDFSNTCFGETKNKDGTFTMKFKVPGYQKEEVKITFSERYSNNRCIDVFANNEEFGFEKYSSIVHRDIDEKSVKATLRNGILTVSYSLQKPKNSSSSIKIED
jgi:HSP20 family molecular chaperone IbpA